MNEARAYVEDETGQVISSVQAYWFAWFTFYPDTELYISEVKS
jgi:hypothetical protein